MRMMQYFNFRPQRHIQHHKIKEGILKIPSYRIEVDNRITNNAHTLQPKPHQRDAPMQGDLKASCAT